MIVKFQLSGHTGQNLRQSIIHLKVNIYLNQCIELLLLSRVVYICFLLLNGAAARDKVYQLLAHGRWFSPGTPTSSTTKTGRHNIAEILLKVALNTITQIKSLLNTIKWF